MNTFIRYSAVGALLLLLGSALSAQQVSFTAGPSVGPVLLSGSNGGFAWGDINGDGYPDLWFAFNNVLLSNGSGTGFTAAASTRTSRFSGDFNSVGGLMADINGDGVLDFWSTNNANPSGGLYYDSSGVLLPAAGTGSLSTAGNTANVFIGLAVADIDHSNYLSAAWPWSPVGGIADAVVYPKGNGITLMKGGAAGFTKVGKGASGGSLAIDTTRSFESWQVHFLDANNDGYPDLLMPSFRHGFTNTDIQVDSMGARKGCILYLNDGTGKFIVPTAATLGRTIYNVDSISQGKSWGRAVGDTGIIVDDTVRHFAGIGSQWGDINNDGNVDLIFIGLGATDNYNGQGALVQNVVIYGKGDGTFTYKWNGSSYVYHGLPQSGIRAWDVGDYNNDGIPDLLGSPNFASAIMLRGNGNGTFTDVSAAVGIGGPGGRAGGFIDYNNDGFLDAYTYTGGNSVLQKNGGNGNNWIAFTPVGTGSNKSAIGARFTLYTQGGTLKQTRFITAEGNASGGTHLRANFGIGLSTSVDSVAVWWPDGTRKTYPGTALAINKYWTIKEGSDIPGATTLTYPANSATAVVTGDTLKWNAATNAVQYSVQVSMDPTFANTKLRAVNATVSGTTYPFSLGAGTTYYWRVAAVNGGFTSAYTSANSFTTAGSAASTVPVKILPIGNITNQPSATVFRVSKTANASRYQWQVSTLPAFTPFISDSTADTTYSVQLSGGTTYYWRVRAMNDLGASAYSAVDTFTTMAVAARPSQLIPANGTLNAIVDSVTYTWSKVAAAASYNLQIATVNGTSVYSTTDTTYKFYNLARNTTYLWAVQSVNIGGVSLFTGNFSFTTVPAVPAVPAVQLPASAAVSVNRLARFAWTPVVNASKYRVQVALDNAFATIVRDTTTTDTTITLNAPLAASTDHYWRASSSNFGGASAYSTARLFTTGTALKVEVASSVIPKEFTLFQNYPNPFNPSTTITYDIPLSAHVTMKVYDVLGRVVATLVDGVQAASSYKVQWNASTVGSGMYFCRIQARSLDGTSNFTSVKKMLFVK